MKYCAYNVLILFFVCQHMIASYLYHVNCMFLLLKKIFFFNFRNELYIDYKNRTSALVPLPQSCYGACPNFLKCLCCCEFPLYDHMNEENEKIEIKSDNAEPDAIEIRT